MYGYIKLSMKTAQLTYKAFGAWKTPTKIKDSGKVVL
jgi:hypothetical protein